MNINQLKNYFYAASFSILSILSLVGCQHENSGSHQEVLAPVGAEFHPWDQNSLEIHSSPYYDSKSDPKNESTTHLNCLFHSRSFSYYQETKQLVFECDDPNKQTKFYKKTLTSSEDVDLNAKLGRLVSARVPFSDQIAPADGGGGGTSIFIKQKEGSHRSLLKDGLHASITTRQRSNTGNPGDILGTLVDLTEVLSWIEQVMSDVPFSTPAPTPSHFQPTFH